MPHDGRIKIIYWCNYKAQDPEPIKSHQWLYIVIERGQRERKGVRQEAILKVIQAHKGIKLNNKLPVEEDPLKQRHYLTRNPTVSQVSKHSSWKYSILLADFSARQQKDVTLSER